MLTDILEVVKVGRQPPYIERHIPGTPQLDEMLPRLKSKCAPRNGSNTNAGYAEPYLCTDDCDAYLEAATVHASCLHDASMHDS
eukprot:COSAG05_NODE_2990_length_2432_cov_6.367767_2_plen_84_part_00